EEGKPVGLFRPISLWPFPEIGLKALLKQGVKNLIVVEANNGQMLEDVRLAADSDTTVVHYGVGGGHIFSPDEIYREILRFV
ncbi:MAG: 3-methyl-2-oxobutanoate dehydrogenase subunit beta, partial [Desulfobacteraceae bacterium]